MTKLNLLQAVSEEEILNFYFPSFQGFEKNYQNPFTTSDTNPSLSFFNTEKGIRFKAHNSAHKGDVFQFVGYLKGIDCKTDFPTLIELVAKDFSLNGYALKKPDEKGIKVNSITAPVISFEDSFTPHFIKYFEQFKISEDTLKRFNVQQVFKHSFISKAGKHCSFDYRRQNKIVACYTINEKIKLYQPEIKNLQEKAFLFKNQSSSDIFGWKQICQGFQPGQKKIQNLFIAAGEKDCLALNSNGFPAISFQSETIHPPKSIINQIKGLAANVFILYDNDQPGIEAAASLQKISGFLILHLPEKVKDSADYFSKFKPADLLKKTTLIPPPITPSEPRQEEESEEVWTIFHQAEKYLSKNYTIRFNTIQLQHECKKIGADKFDVLNENNLYVEMNKAGIRISVDKLLSILKSDFVTHYNPFTEYFENLPEWDEQRDYIGELADFVKTENPKEFKEQFTKWLVRTVACAIVPGYYNKQAFILVHSAQNSGKSTFCRFLCPPALKDYIAENISDDKDSKIAIAKNFLINLDELSSLAKHEINSLKSLFSKDIINERLPYDRKNSIIHRVASFLGSTNMTAFLTDETGSVRWLCFEILRIDWKYKTLIDINKVWGQSYDLFKAGYDAELTPADIKENEIRNAKFQQLSPEAELIPNFLKPSSEIEGGVFVTSTDVLMYLSSFTSIRLNKISVGKAMLQNGFKRAKDSLLDRYGYYVIKLK